MISNMQGVEGCSGNALQQGATGLGRCRLKEHQSQQGLVVVVAIFKKIERSAVQHPGR